jgi:CRP-like cAMP-binding protein
LRFIAARARTSDFAPGETLCTEGERGDEFFVIVDGSAEARHGGAVLRTLGPGDFFGEIGLLDAGPRSATVVATAAMRCFTIPSREFRDVLSQNSAISVRVLDAVVQRLRSVQPQT